MIKNSRNYNRYFGLSFWLLLAPLWIFGQSAEHDQQEAQYRLIQQEKIDQLTQQSLDVTDTAKSIKTHQKIVALYMELNLDSALVYAEKGLALAEAFGNKRSLGNTRLNLSNVLFQMSSVEPAIALLLENRAEQQQLNDTLLAITETALSVSYSALGDYEKAIEASLTAINLFELANDSTNTGFNYISLSEVYLQGLKDRDSGLKYIRKSIELLKSQHTPPQYLIGALVRYGDVCSQVKDYDNSEAKFQEALELAIKHDDYWYMSDIYFGLGKIYHHKKEYKTSTKYLEKAIEKSDNLEHRLVRIYRYLGLNHRDLGEAQKAISYFEQCLSMEKNLENQIDTENLLVGCYLQLSNYKKAFEFQKQITVHQDSIHRSEQDERIIEVIEKYENQKKELMIEKLDAENQHKEKIIAQQKLSFGVVIALLMLLGVGGFFWIRFRQKLREGIDQLEKTQLQQRFLQVQLNPHFLFHALSSIESYIYTHEKESAAAFLRNFSKLMRNILESSDQDFVSLKNDLDTMREYLVIQQLNSNFKFDYSINIDENLNLQSLQIPPMLIQPFIENAILHGALNVPEGMVKVEYLLKDKHLQIQIHDNGPGLQPASRKNGTLMRSMGMEIVQQRIRNLKETHGIQTQYRIESLEGHIGTTVVLDMSTQHTQTAFA